MAHQANSIRKDKLIRKLVKDNELKRLALKTLIHNLASEQDEEALKRIQFQANIKLSRLPRNSSKVRVRNRCILTGRSRGTYRYFKMSRIMLKDLGVSGQIPGLTKSSW